VVTVILLAIAQLSFAAAQGVFETRRTVRLYAAAAELTRRATDPNSVVIALNHNGSIRYYGERMTMNVNHMEPAAVDDAVRGLEQRGVRTYAALEAVEVEDVRSRFGASTTLIDALNRPPKGVLNHPSQFKVFELKPGPSSRPPIVMDSDTIGWDALQPGSPPRLTLREKQP